MIIVAILVFGFLIFTHELGHFLAAKKMGVNVLEFAIGMGPALYSKEKNGTLYCIRLFPIGGFCQMEGEDTEAEGEGAFGSKSIAARFFILVSGALMNLLTGFLVLVILFGSNEAATNTVIASFKEGATPTKDAGMMVGDKIIKIDNQKIRAADDILYYLNRFPKDNIDIVVVRGGEKVVLSGITFPYFEVDKSEYTGDIRDKGKVERVYTTDFYVERQDNNILHVLKDSFNKSVNTAKLIWVSFFDLLTGNVPISDVSGPVGVTTVIGDAANAGIRNLLSIVVLIAINLGVLNLMPLPALDGGRIVFLILEIILRKPVPAKYEGYVHFGGLVLILGFSVLITFNDIVRLVIN